MLLLASERHSCDFKRLNAIFLLGRGACVRRGHAQLTALLPLITIETLSTQRTNVCRGSNAGIDRGGPATHGVIASDHRRKSPCRVLVFEQAQTQDSQAR